MNDLTYGATLLACFVCLVVTVAFEASTPARRDTAQPAAARAAASPGPSAKASASDCTTLALSPATTAH
jgi:hypothetical protein